MVSSCSAYGCTNRYEKGSKVQFHRFPIRKPVLLKKWLFAMRRKSFQPSKLAVICSSHFTNKDYKTTCRKLKDNAVPSIFNFSKHLEKSIKKRGIIKKAHQKVCELHFKKSDVETETSAYDSKTGRTITAPLGVKRLKKGAIPTLNIPKFYSEASVSSRKDCEEKQMQIEKEQLHLALEQSLINASGETLPPEDTVDSDLNSSLPLSRQMEINNVENQQKIAKKKRKSEKEEIFNKKLNGTCNSNLIEESTDVREITQNHDLTNSRNDISTSNLSLKVHIKEENPWEEEYGFLNHNFNSDMVKIVNVESSSSNGTAKSTDHEMETKESCDTSFYKKPLKIDSRDETFGKLVACEMSDLRGNPELYIKTQQSILKLLVEAHFELMSSV